MRIIAEIPHPEFKVTVFQMNGKLSVKLEKNLLEQTYKFRDGAGIATVEDVKSFLTEALYLEVDHIFSLMQKNRYQGLLSAHPEDEFDNII